MTVKEFYEQIGSDYSRVMRTLMNDVIATKFLVKFTDDKSYSAVLSALAGNDVKAQFTAVHAFKGVAGNLGFYKLYEVTSELCEQLRPLKETANPELVLKMKAEYDNVILTLNKFKEEI